jgi:hypothetical protein
MGTTEIFRSVCIPPFLGAVLGVVIGIRDR